MNTMFAFAGPNRTTYQAKIIKPDGYPLEASSVNFKFTILDPVGSCILYSETYSSVNMSATSGLISFALGSGVKTYPVSATTFEQVFSNITPSLSCDTGGPANYAPAASDSRKIVMQFHDGNGWQTLPAMSINAVPYAMYANDSLLLNGLQATDFVQLSVVPTCTASEAIRYNGTSFSCVTVGAGGSVTSGSVITALGYTPADGVSVTTLTSNISTVSSTVSSLSTSVSSLSSTVVGLSASMAAITSSQWLTSGTTINYLAGNVGIGTNAPSVALEVSGGVKLSGTSATLDIPVTSANSGYMTMGGELLLHAFGNYNLYLGRSAGNLTGSGLQNTGIGHHALKDVTNGYENVALGDFTMAKITTGGENTALGSEAMSFSVSGTGNVAVGIQALLRNSSDENTVVGAYALNRTGNGSKNTGTGYAVMNMLTTGSNNVGAGWMALRNITTGSSNIAIGYNAGSDITTGSGNIIIGGNTGATFATDSNNISINDGVGNERIRVVSSGLVGIGTTTPVTKLDVSGAIRISMDSATCSAGYAGSIRYNAGSVEMCNGTTWSAFGVAGAGITNLNGSASGAQTFATGISGTVFNISSSNGIHTFNIPLAATGSVTAGLLSNADYATFTNKLNATSAAVISALGYTPIDNSVSATFALRANNLSDLSSSATARINLGLGSLAQLNFIDLSGSQASGTLAVARLPAFSGDVSSSVGTAVLTLANVGAGVTSGTQYTKVTVDGKGRVTSGAQLSTADVTTALGYTPASASASTQWVTSGTAISYTAGNVGIGITTPNANLDVASAAAISNTNWKNTSGTRQIPLQFRSGGSAAELNGPVAQVTGIDRYVGGSYQGALAFFTQTANSLTEKMRIDENGNVGIGTTTPAAKLDVSGNIILSGGSEISRNVQDGGIIVLGGTTFGTDSSMVAYGSTNGGNENRVSINSTRFEVRNVASAITKLVVDNSGNVGVGTTAPTAKLHVAAGTSATASFKLTSGTLLTSPQSGTMEYDGSQFYLTDGANTRRTIATGSSAGTIDNASTINSTGNITMVPVGSVVVSSTTASTNSQTGALIVKGGMGIAGDIYTSGTIVTSSNIQGVSVTATSGMVSPYLYGSTVSGGSLYIDSTMHASKGNISLAPNGGNVGIGTTVPVGKLTIQGIGTTTGTALRVEDSGAVQRFLIQDNGQVGIRATPYNSYANNGNNADLALNGSLDFAGSGSLSSSGLFSFTTHSSGWRNWQVDPENSRIFYNSAGGVINVLMGNSDASGTFGLYNAGAERLRIDTSGNVGIGTTTPQEKLHVSGTMLATGDWGSGPTLTVSGAGTRMFFYPRKAAFRAGYANSDEWDENNIGEASFAFGDGAVASGSYSVAMGRTAQALAPYSVALGQGQASGDYSTAFDSSDASGMYSVAMGSSSAQGDRAIAMGGSSSANGESSVAIGRAVISNSFRSVAVGSYNIGSGSLTTWVSTDPIFEIGNSQNGIPRSNAMTVLKNGNVGIGTSAPVARLQITPGTSSVAPIKFGLGVLLTTPQSGTIEYDGSGYYVTDNSGVRRTIATATTGGVLTNTNTVSSTSNITLWPAAANSVIVSSTVASTNSTTGALIVNGGAGIAGALNVSGIISGSAMIKGTGFRANQGAPDAADSSTVGYAFGQDGDTGIFSPGSGAANGVLSFYNNNAETMRINPGAVGIGTSNPSFPLDIQGSNAFQQRIYHASNNANDDAAIMMTRTRGTTSAAAGVQSGDSIGGMYFRAHDGTSTNTTNAYIEVEAGETHSPTNRGSIMTFASTIASAATNTEIMRIHSNGYVGIGSTAPNALLQVGPTGSQATNYNIYVGSYNSSAGQGSYVGNWASSVYWGLGPATAASDNTLRLGNAADRTGTWSGTQNLNLVMGGNLSVGSGTAATYKFLATKDFNGIQSQTAAFIGGIDAGTANTGIYVVQKDNLSLATNTSYLLNVVHNNNSKFLVTGAGNVGIGTTTPTDMLTVSSVSAGAIIRLDNSNAGRSWRLLSNDASGTFAIRDETAATNRISINSLGNVGIGTTNPTSTLQVNGTSLFTTAVGNHTRIHAAGNGYGGASPLVLSSDRPATTGASLVKGIVDYNGDEGGASTRFEIFNDGGGYFLGNVGIGTSSPSTTLHVNGTMRVVDGNQAAGRVLASDASGNAAWKQTIIHGTITSTGNSSTALGQRVSSGVSITLPPGRWSITGMGITTAASCRADFGIRTLADAVVKYTLMPVATGDFQTATVTGYVDIAVTTTYELYIGSRAACTSTIHVDNTLWELTATGVAY